MGKSEKYLIVSDVKVNVSYTDVCEVVSSLQIQP